VVVEVILNELDTGRERGWRHAERLKELVASRQIEIVRLSDAGWQHFEALVVGPAEQTLDDGEAATIAYAADCGAVAILDEKKGTRLAAVRFPSVGVITTVDLLFHPHVRRTLGMSEHSNAVFAALREARMAVLPSKVDDVVRLIGLDRARLCPSLPKGSRLAVRAAPGEAKEANG
jgi:predicted nucleic acid-binding protein